MFCVVNSNDWNWKNEKNNFCLELKKNWLPNCLN